MTEPARQLRTNWMPWLALCTTILLALSGCAEMDSAAKADFESPPENPEQAPEIYEAQTDMLQHDVHKARERYEQLLAKSPNHPAASVGKAITDILLLPFSSEMDDIITENLGGSAGLGSTRDVIYGEQGLLDLLSLGVPWEDSGGLSGIHSQLSPDLPWTKAQLESSETFFAGLDAPVNELADNLTALAGRMEDIEGHLDTALESSDFEVFFVPGEVFHYEKLNLYLGKSELSWIRAGVSAMRGLFYFGGAYGHEWNLETAFGPHWSEVMNSPMEHPEEYVEGYERDDYVTRYLDEHLGRSIRKGPRLGDARTALRSALRFTRLGIQAGQSAEGTSLDWDATDKQFIGELAEFIEALENSLDGRTTLPFATPPTSIDLSPFFTDGRTLDPNISWMERSVVQDEFGQWVEWSWTDAAVESFFIEGIFEPSFDPDNPPDIQFSGDAGSFGDSVSGDLRRDVEDAYLATH